MKILPLKSEPTLYPEAKRAGEFCPNCRHGIGGLDRCQWCGWPDFDGAARRTRIARKRLEIRAAAARQVT